MRSRALTAAFLLAAASAFGQVVLRPSAVVPAAPPPFARPTAVPFASPSLLMPAPLSLSAALPAAALPAPETRAAALSAALAGFERTDMKTASAGEASSAGETLMLRALGASVDSAPPVVAVPVGTALARPSARSNAPALYLLSRPLRETVSLGRLSMSAHVLYVVVYQVVKTYLVWKTFHSPALIGTMLLVDLPTMPSGLTMNTLLDLGQRYWRRKLAVLKELALTPAVSRVKVLTTGVTTFAGPIAREKDNTGLIFVEAGGELPETLGRFGAPIPLGDPSASRVRLVFVQDLTTSAVAWTPTLKDLLERRPLPPAVAAAWRAFTKGRKGQARIEAVYLGADGSERPVGEISQGSAVRKFIGLGWLDRARSFLGATLPSRSIPISDTAIERPGDAREAGPKAALSRAWRRLTGRLIVAKAP
jgi:hypothetical protein